MNKIFISPGELFADSFKLAGQIVADGCQPDLLIGLWRGGAPVAITVQEALATVGKQMPHMALRCSSYGLPGERGRLEVQGLEQLGALPQPVTSVLVVDDVLDSGQTWLAVRQALAKALGIAQAQIQLAVIWYKPGSLAPPDYYLRTTADWLVFPHELLGLSEAEIEAKGIKVPREFRHRLAAP